MTKKKKFLTILILLIITLCLYTFIIKREEIHIFINSLKSKIDNINIPYDKTVNHNNYKYLSVKETYNFKPQNIEDIKSIYYTVLNNGWTDFSFYCPKDYENCINDVKKIANNNEYTVQINNYVNTYNTYRNYNTLIYNDKEVYLKIEKLYSEEDIININNELDKIFKLLNIDSYNKEESIKVLHDYLIENTKYDKEYINGDEDTISNKANGVLFKQVALCSGYTDTFSLMLNKLDIPNFRISNEDHIWNVIYINNEWKHIDITWDDDEINKENQYKYYLLSTDELLEKDNDVHKFNRNIYLEVK